MQQSNQEVAIDCQKMRQRYRAVMLLAAVGDAIGYRGGSWEFNYDGPYIHRDMMKITKQKGVLALQVEKEEFPYSDDTVMHVATAKGLLNSKRNDDNNAICTSVAKEYKMCMNYMAGRAPGGTCMRSASKLKEDGSNWNTIKFSPNAGGCGAAMRAACIGLYYYDNLQKVIQLSIETGRTTHHNPLGYLGSMVSAYFTALAIRNIPPFFWHKELIEHGLAYSKQYVQKGREGEENMKDWVKFQNLWNKFASARNLTIEGSPPCFPQKYSVQDRQQFYGQFALSGWPGALGIDSVIIAYDALLSAMYAYQTCKKQQGFKNTLDKLWEEVCLRGMLHGGDSDSTGTIVGAWYGAIHGFEGVPTNHYQHSEKREEIQKLGDQLFEKSYGDDYKKHKQSQILDV